MVASEVVVAVMVRVHHVCNRFVADSTHRFPDVLADLVRSARVDQHDSLVAHHDRRIDHEALVDAIRVLHGP